MVSKKLEETEGNKLLIINNWKFKGVEMQLVVERNPFDNFYMWYFPPNPKMYANRHPRYMKTIVKSLLRIHKDTVVIQDLDTPLTSYAKKHLKNLQKGDSNEAK